MKNLNLIVIASMMTAGSAMAADAAFENHLNSAPIVSPAQIYQIDDLRTDFALGFQNAEGTSKPEGADEMKASSSTTDLFAAGIYNIKAIGLRAGLVVNYGSGNAKTDTFDATTSSVGEAKQDTTDFVASPTVAMPVGPVVLGAALDVTQTTLKPEEGDEAKATYTTFRPGVLFQNKDLEAGLAYKSATNKTDEGDVKKLPVQDPASVTAHGRVALSREVAVGGIIQNVHYKGLNEDAYKDQTRVKATGEFGAGAVKIEGDLGYNTAFYKSKTAGFGEDTIGTIGLGAAADYSVNKDTAVGGGLGYEFGSDKAEGTKVAANQLTVAVRGNMKF